MLFHGWQNSDGAMGTFCWGDYSLNSLIFKEDKGRGKRDVAAV